MYYWEKPKNLRYVDMCKWIDENSHKEDFDQTRLFDYLYGIILILAYKWRYFDNSMDYDDFSMYVATAVFYRICSNKKKQIEYILPYLKKSLKFFLVQWKNKYSSNEQETKYSTTDKLVYGNHVQDLLIGGINKCNFKIYLDDISSAIYESIKFIPKKIGSAEFQNIYMSCILTFLNQITMTSQEETLVKNLESNVSYESAYNRIYGLNNQDDPILYHLDQSYSRYIKLLVNIARSNIRKELEELLYENVPTISISDMIEETDDYGKFEET